MHYCCVNSHLMHYQLLQFLRFSHYDWFKVCMRSGSVRLSFKEGTSGVVVVAAAATRINIRKAQRCAKRFPSSFLLGWMNFKRNNFNKKNSSCKIIVYFEGSWIHVFNILSVLNYKRVNGDPRLVRWHCQAIPMTMN